MTDIIKPFKILETKVESGGDIGVSFEAEKVIYVSESARRTVGVRSYISVPAGGDVDQAVFDHLNDLGWLG
jgi:hypothetical protein